MPNLVSSIDQVLLNVATYNREIERFRDIMSNARAWYAVRKDDKWLFAPSKVIGYSDVSADWYFDRPYDPARHGRINPKDYREDALDGRVTERVLAQWSEPLGKSYVHFDEVMNAFESMFSRMRKKPSSLARIAIFKTTETAADFETVGDQLVPLLASIFKRLSADERKEFRTLTAR